MQLGRRLRAWQWLDVDNAQYLPAGAHCGNEMSGRIELLDGKDGQDHHGRLGAVEDGIVGIVKVESFDLDIGVTLKQQRSHFHRVAGIIAADKLLIWKDTG